jgi:3-hydroxyisobutyrate dehydrogenase/2-hydroxy-3-oxopropionate reductase
MKLGFIGLGRMGRRMAQRLVDAGHELNVFDAVAAKADLPGARTAACPRELGTCEAVLMSVTDGTAVLAALQGPDGLLAGAKPGLLLIELTTIGVADSERVAALCAPKGLDYVRSPLLGTLDSAASGRLTALMSGPEGAIDRAHPIMAELCQEQHYLGPTEEGRVAKLVANGMLAAGQVALSEALALGQKAGMPLDRLLEVILGSSSASPVIKGTVQKMRQRDFEPRLTVALLAKDLRLLNELAAARCAPVPQASANLQLYEAAVNMGCWRSNA